MLKNDATSFIAWHLLKCCFNNRSEIVTVVMELI